jgi:hypothetical protein
MRGDGWIENVIGGEKRRENDLIRRLAGHSSNADIYAVCARNNLEDTVT